MEDLFTDYAQRKIANPQLEDEQIFNDDEYCDPSLSKFMTIIQNYSNYQQVTMEVAYDKALQFFENLDNPEEIEELVEQTQKSMREERERNQRLESEKEKYP